MSDPTDSTGEVVFRQRMTATAAAAGLIALAMAALAYRQAPLVPDLYNVIYPPTARPHRAESPIVFLFGFPVALLIGALLFRLAPTQRKRPWPSAFVVAFLLLWISVFFFGSLHRSWLVLALSR